MPNPNMKRPGNQNAKKENPKSRLIQFRASPELAQCLSARADGVSVGVQARIELEGLFGVER